MKVKSVSFKSPNAAQEFANSLRETGFAVLKDHPIDSDLIFAAYDEWARFFASPHKFDLTFDPQSQSGYFPFKSENAKGYSKKDLKEFYHYYPWGELPADAQTVTPKLYAQMRALGSTLLTWINEVTPAEVRRGFSMPLQDMVTDSGETLLRALHYPPLGENVEEGAVRAAAHEDINLITLLPAATAPGLQVQDLAGTWHEVACDPGTIAINSGDMLKMCSGQYYPSTTHRVVNPIGPAARQSRFSMPLFLHPRKDVALSTQHTAGSYLDERLREIGLKRPPATERPETDRPAEAPVTL